ncbi:hypothetical protein GL263_06905 [Streptomyces durbertensis]|uniref:Uncharacterized protein n=1 Tax=Streptomyces durbertensis TaxID=2448886 RepID=A0ABR6ED74_9ACTN|nr:hypothetical protein [Streptomyces durbertensis]
MVPPPPSRPPTVGVPGEPRRAALVGLLNLSGLGLGYVALRHWWSAAACWAAAAGLLAVALPVEPSGVPGAAVAAFAVVVLAAALDGARRGLRTPVLPFLRRPALALPLAFLLLAVPASGAVAYDAARGEAVQQALLDRLEEADKLVEEVRDKDFEDARPSYRKALGVYADIGSRHGDSRAGRLVPERLDTYYRAVARPYGGRDYCGAVEPLRYLRTVPDKVDRDVLGRLADWPNQRLARSWFECGMERLGSVPEDNGNGGGRHLADLLDTFPESPQARRVQTAVSDRIKSRTDELEGERTCDVADELTRVSATVDGLPGDAGAALRGDAKKAVEKGAYACGVHEFKEKRFSSARSKLTRFANEHRDSSLADRARDIAIAAEIAQSRPAAGRGLPPAKAPGGARMPLTVSNDGQGSVEILYTGPVTGKVTVRGCPGCTVYPTRAEARQKACKDSSKTYPKTTIRLPAGEYHILYKRSTTATISSRGRTYADGARIRPGYTYTGCTYVTRGLGIQ